MKPIRVIIPKHVQLLLATLPDAARQDILDQIERIAAGDMSSVREASREEVDELVASGIIQPMKPADDEPAS